MIRSHGLTMYMAIRLSCMAGIFDKIPARSWVAVH